MRAIDDGREPVMSWPLKKIFPRVVVRKCVRRLKQVVLPAPLGPISAWMVPFLTARSTPLTATNPLNSLVSPRVSSIVSSAMPYVRQKAAPGRSPLITCAIIRAARPLGNGFLGNLVLAPFGRTLLQKGVDAFARVSLAQIAGHDAHGLGVGVGEVRLDLIVEGPFAHAD